ncbi:MAG: dihydroxyacetone kinase subunit L [Treponema sp.]|jgi:dihydroxyacetone kinase-like protein|nr:dihydroxyacetone kinase subunit L [Treponema sp.]
MENITLSLIKTALLNVIEELGKKREYFNDLDSPIGDSDHGDSVVSTFSLVEKAINDYDTAGGDIGGLFTCVGKAIIMGGGASMGPLYGTAFMDAGKSAAGKKELDYGDFTAMWEAFVEGIRRRGNVKPGEKTMYDTIFPAVTVLSAEQKKGLPFEDVLPLVVKAAVDGMNSTKDMLATRGRASRLGERSIGHIDPGAASMCCLVEVFFGTLGSNPKK